MSGEFDQFVVRDDIDVGDIRELINEYATLDIDEGLIQFSSRYRDAKIKTQLLVPLLAVYSFNKEGITDDAAIEAVELIEITTATPGEAYPVLRRLEQEGLLENTGKAYRIVPEKFEHLEGEVDEEATVTAAD